MAVEHQAHTATVSSKLKTPNKRNTEQCAHWERMRLQLKPTKPTATRIPDASFRQPVLANASRSPDSRPIATQCEKAMSGHTPAGSVPAPAKRCNGARQRSNNDCMLNFGLKRSPYDGRLRSTAHHLTIA